MTLLFHGFLADEADKEPRSLANAWPGGDKCRQCQRPRFEHTAEIRHSSIEWSGPSLAHEIDGQLRASWRALREERRKTGDASVYTAELYYKGKLAEYFALRNIGLGRTSRGSLNSTIQRKMLARIAEYSAPEKVAV